MPRKGAPKRKQARSTAVSRGRPSLRAAVKSVRRAKGVCKNRAHYGEMSHIETRLAKLAGLIR